MLCVLAACFRAAGRLSIVGAALTESSGFYGAYNFGPIPDDVLSVKQLTEMAVEILGKGNYTCPILQNQPHEANMLKLDISKAFDKLQWFPKLNSRESIEWTLEIVQCRRE